MESGCDTLGLDTCENLSRRVTSSLCLLVYATSSSTSVSPEHPASLKRRTSGSRERLHALKTSLVTESPSDTTLSRLWYCLTWSQFKRENEWTPRTVTRIQDIVSHRIIHAHDTFQTVVLFDVVAVQKGERVNPENGYTHSRHR
ncbi:hypothetical protein DPMN_067892 [Dreissena polymorpha]|uniref:Uncharacterized protein n=1 Tax=Dreissena polymorpha TaxID=45954 RepID=A0A9D3Z0J0_DREPO|nr:hypothetical protein DPMN_067892 [Dreissena polymorpha]